MTDLIADKDDTILFEHEYANCLDYTARCIAPNLYLVRFNYGDIFDA